MSPLTNTLGAPLETCLRTLIPEQARASHRRFPLIDQEDFEQQMWLKGIERADGYRKLLAERPDEAYALIGHHLRDACTRYGAADLKDRRARKAAAAGYHIDDEFFYTRRVAGHLISEMIESEWHLASVLARSTKGDLSGTRVQSGSDTHDSFIDYLALLMDVKSAFSELKPSQQEYLARWYGEGDDDEAAKHDHEAIAASMGLTYDAFRMRKNRALDSMIGILGGESPYANRVRGEANENS